MPELPDLTVVAEELARRASGREVARAEAPTPILLRATPQELTGLVGTRTGAAARRGKFLLLPFVRTAPGAPDTETRDGGSSPHADSAAVVLAVNPMLAGRFWLHDGAAPVLARTGIRLVFTDGGELRYVDRELLGKAYLVPPDRLESVPGWADMGPDADDPALTLDEFRRRIRPHRGELKNLLRNPRFVAGIGNAYSDEILWEARLHPLRRRSTLSDDQIADLYHAMRRVLAKAVEHLRRLVPPNIEVQHREILRVHRRRGEPCPRCGKPLRQIGPNSEATTFCRSCQPPA